MKLTIEDRSTRIGTSLTAPLSTINLTRNVRGSERNIHGAKPENDHLNHGKFFETLNVSSEQTCLFKHHRGFTTLSPLKAEGTIKICTETPNMKTVSFYASGT
jgi:hypothetical protein